MIYINRGVFPPTRSPSPPFLAYPRARTHTHTHTSLAAILTAPSCLILEAKAGCYRQFALSNFSCVTYRVPDSARSLSRCNYTWSRTSAVFNVDVCRTTRRFSPILPIYYPLLSPRASHCLSLFIILVHPPTYVPTPTYFFHPLPLLPSVPSFETSSSHSIRAIPTYSNLVLELFVFPPLFPSSFSSSSFFSLCTP